MTETPALEPDAPLDAPAPAPQGQVALCGGNEFRRDCDPMDLALLERVGGRQAAQILVLPTAATNENPYVAGESGIRHFLRLGAQADKAMIVDRTAADRVDLVEPLEKCNVAYFTSGDPIFLAETLAGSLLWEAVLALHQRGGLVAGSSAGAMMLGAYLWRFDAWIPGLGLAPGVAVLPHHATLSARWNVPAMAASLPPGITLVGVDEATALILPERRVVGIGEVTVYGAGGPQTFAADAVLPPFQAALGA
jgi:cyanophycinase